MVSMDMTSIAAFLTENEVAILSGWVVQQKAAGALATGRISETELRVEGRNFLKLLRSTLEADVRDAHVGAYRDLRDFIGEISSSRAAQGFTPSEAAAFVFSLKWSLLEILRRDHVDEGGLAGTLRSIGDLLDQLGVHGFDAFNRSREGVILRQRREIAELSTPVLRLWDGVLALPLIGTLDSERTQVMMENLLQSIVDTGAQIAIIDITGVVTVDTLTAQHLLKTVAAARLMGADCLISGLRPQIAQTMVHLGVELNVVTKATLADAFATALRRTGRVVQVRSGPLAPRAHSCMGRVL